MSRYKKKDNVVEDDDGVTRKCVPSKVVWYLPITQRFKRLFANVNDTKNIRRHVDERLCNGKICHVVDSLQWNKIDMLFPECPLSQGTLGSNLSPT